MKKTSVLFILAFITFYMGAETLAIGISPARRTFDISEFDCTFNSNLGYTLTRPDTRYSLFTVYNKGGLTGTITSCSASNSIEYIDDNNILIDWESNELNSVGSITSWVSVKSPSSWDCQAVPGGGSYMFDLVRHSDVIETSSGVGAGVAVISQLSLWRNYALRGTVSGIQESYQLNQAVLFDVGVVDYYVGQGFLKWFDFSYTIDWESDGIIDQTLTGIRMTDDLGQTAGDAISTGFKYKDLNFEHLYSNGGEYLITLNLHDSIETTTLQIPVHVTPEPTTLFLLGMGSLFMRKKHN